MGHLDTLYCRLPVLVQHAAVSLYGTYWRWLRFGPGYKYAVKNYLAREHYTHDAWRSWQQERISQLLKLAAKHVPYYNETWGRDEERAASAGRLDQLPLLEKEPIRAAPEAFLRQDDTSSHRFVFHTSGSTGTPIASYWTAPEIRDSLALREVRSARWAGVSFREPRATFSGRMVVPDPASNGPFYRFNLAERQVYFSAFHLRPETAHDYIHALERHNIQWLTGYAVSYFLLARFILEQNLRVPPLKAIITTSEKVTPAMRETMEMAFQCPVYEEYSTVENALFASECEKGQLHVSPDVAIVEILRPDGTPCEPGETGEVVSTCLMRPTQPFIRYRLGDLATWDSEPCTCGRAMPVIKEVVGRIEDVVVGPDGRQLVRFHGIFTDQPYVREGQIIQESLDHIHVKIVPVTGFGPADVSAIVQRVEQRLGPEVDVTVEPVASIPRTAAGKFRAVVSKLPRERNEVG